MIDIKWLEPSKYPQRSHQFYRLKNRPKTTLLLVDSIFGKSLSFKNAVNHQTFYSMTDHRRYFISSLILKSLKNTFLKNRDFTPMVSFMRGEGLMSTPLKMVAFNINHYPFLIYHTIIFLQGGVLLLIFLKSQELGWQIYR